MANTAGREMTPDEISDYVSYGNAGLPLPEKFRGVVLENTAGKHVYRFATAAEAKAGEDAVAAEVAAVEDAQKRTEKLRAEAAKAGVEVLPPPAPPAPAPAASGESRGR